MASHEGTVVWFNNAKGYGFVQADGGIEVFCHYSAIQSEHYKTLREGQRVDFDVEKDGSGRDQASNVRVVRLTSSE